jgi:cyclophilin family peptidyl-prolyl cis-trans isomerase
MGSARRVSSARLRVSRNALPALRYAAPLGVAALNHAKRWRMHHALRGHRTAAFLILMVVVVSALQRGQAQATGAVQQQTVAQSWSSAPPFVIDPWAGYTATIATDAGAIVLELDAAAAPVTVNTFLFLAQQHFYDGLSFQRIVPGLLAQAGATQPDGTGGAGYTVPTEGSPLPHASGAVATALTRSLGDLWEGSQFYISLSALPQQDGKDTVFGYVTQGLAILQALPGRDPQQAAGQGLVIQSVSVVSHDRDPGAPPIVPPATALPPGVTPPFTLAPQTTYTADIQTAQGEIIVTLDAVAAPYTVNNFVYLAEQHFYDGVSFCRVLRDVLAQACGPDGTTSSGPGYTIPDEPNALTHEQGVIAMANTGQPNSASGQFYLTLAPQPQLDGLDTVFGTVTQGFSVAQALAARDPATASGPGDQILAVTIAQN